LPPHTVVKWGHYTSFAGDWNYPHDGGTRPAMWGYRYDGGGTQIAQGHGHVRMLWPQEVLLNGQGPLVELLGLGILSAGVQERRQIVGVHRPLIVVWPVEAFKDSQGAPVQGFRLGVLALRVQDGGQGGHVDGRLCAPCC
jgi:hypothetical protein